MNIFIIIITTLFSLHSFALAKGLKADKSTHDNHEKIIWLVEDKKENVNLLDKTAPNTSVASYIESRVISELGQYDIEIKRVAIKRIDQILQSTPNACAANRAKLEARQKYSIYSTPQAFYLTHQLFRFNQTTPLSKSLLNEEGELIAIENVFRQHPTHKIGLAKGVSFGKYLDTEIDKVAIENIYFRGGINRVTALEAMLYLNRVDYLLALPIDINPSEEQKAKLEQYPIAGAPPYLIAHFSCSKSPVGQKVVNDINHILSKKYQSEDYYLAHKKWFTEKDLVKLQAYLQSRFINQSFLKH